MTSASFRIDINEYRFESALLYKLQRKKGPKSNDQSNVDSTFTEDTSTSLQLLVIWKSKSSVRALLIKHSNTIAWNEDTLEKSRSMHLALLRDNLIVKDIWLLDNATVLMTTSKRERASCVFEITVSEGVRENDTMEPLWVSSNM
jgi:hypothetical protein